MVTLKRRVVLLTRSRLRMRQKYTVLAALRIRLKHINVFGEYAKNVLPYMENKVTIVIKLNPQCIGEFFYQNPKMIEWAKPSHTTVPLRCMHSAQYILIKSYNYLFNFISLENKTFVSREYLFKAGSKSLKREKVETMT